MAMKDNVREAFIKRNPRKKAAFETLLEQGSNFRAQRKKPEDKGDWLDAALGVGSQVAGGVAGGVVGGPAGALAGAQLGGKAFEMAGGNTNTDAYKLSQNIAAPTAKIAGGISSGNLAQVAQGAAQAVGSTGAVRDMSSTVSQGLAPGVTSKNTGMFQKFADPAQAAAQELLYEEQGIKFSPETVGPAGEDLGPINIPGGALAPRGPQTNVGGINFDEDFAGDLGSTDVFGAPAGPSSRRFGTPAQLFRAKPRGVR